MFFANVIRLLTHFIFPSVCLLCDKGLKQPDMLCPTCQELLPILPHHCQKCAHSLPETCADMVDMPYCGDCLARDAEFDKVFACFPYQAPINRFILALKFNQQLIYAKALGLKMSQDCRLKWYINEPFPDLIIPVPLFPARLRLRGFNQALEIARPIARKLNIPIDINGVKRIKATLPQRKLSASKRKQNMRGAFECVHSYQNRSVAILDDVMTTGETVRELSRTLRQAGAKTIHIWCAARA